MSGMHVVSKVSYLIRDALQQLFIPLARTSRSFESQVHEGRVLTGVTCQPGQFGLGESLVQQLNVVSELAVQLISSQHVHECAGSSGDVGRIAAAVHVPRAVETHVRAQETRAEGHTANRTHGPTEGGTHHLNVRRLRGSRGRQLFDSLVDQSASLFAQHSETVGFIDQQANGVLGLVQQN